MDTNNEAISVSESMEVVVVDDNRRLREFFILPENLEMVANAVEKVARGLVADANTKDGASQIKSMARSIASVKVAVDNAGKRVVSELKALPKVIDSNRAMFRERLEVLQEEIRKPVTEIENRENRVRKISEMHLSLGSASSDDIRLAIQTLNEIMADESEWKESLEAARKAADGELKALTLLLGNAEKREREAIELEELRKKQAEAERIIREQKIREEAERKAKAESAEREARLTREKEEAERRASEAEKREHEAIVGQEKKESDHSSKLMDDVEHRRDVNRGILIDLEKAVLGKPQEEWIKAIAKALIKGQVRNTNVTY